jgi:AcrR family transcriptional regulator
MKDKPGKTTGASDPGGCGAAMRRGYHHGRLKEALLDAARRLAGERGPAGFTLAEAAKLVGVTAAAPYRHFADRDALLGELARRGFEQFGEALEKAWDDGRPDAVTAARRMGAAYLAFARGEPGLYAAMFGAARTLDAPAPGAAADRALEALRRSAGAMMAQFGAQGDARALALEIWALSHGVAMLTISGHLAPGRAGCDPAEILASGARALVLAAVAPPSENASLPSGAPPSGPWGKRA